jgi:DNA mismatch repair ATPase MutS
MEILILVLLYYLSQNPDFSESVKPLMSKIKDSEQMLSFLSNLSKFTETFSTFQSATAPKHEEPINEKASDKKEEPQSPTQGIADQFIQNILDSYLKKK